MPNRMTGRYSVTQKYLMTRGQALNFPASYFSKEFKNEVFGVVIDIPMPQDVLTTMVCFINGAANLYFNNGSEYSGASKKYTNLVQTTNNFVRNAGIILPKCKKTKVFDLPQGRGLNVFLLTKKGVFATQIPMGVIPETEPELRTFYVLYNRVMNEIHSCQLKDDAESRGILQK